MVGACLTLNRCGFWGCYVVLVVGASLNLCGLVVSVELGCFGMDWLLRGARMF